MIQRETGGNLTELLGVIATMIRDRFKLRNQIKGLTAEGRMSGIFLTALPLLTCGVLYIMSPDHIMLLYTTELGKTLTTAALIMLLLGILIIRKIVNIKM
jgi:tight adherence protein B